MHNDFVYLVEKQTSQFNELLISVPQEVLEAYIKAFEKDPEKENQVKDARLFLAAKKLAVHH